MEGKALENVSNTSGLTPGGMCELQSLSERIPTNTKQLSKITLRQIMHVWSRGNGANRKSSQKPELEMKDSLMCAGKPPSLRKKRSDGERQLGHCFQPRP